MAEEREYKCRVTLETGSAEESAERLEGRLDDLGEHAEQAGARIDEAGESIESAGNRAKGSSAKFNDILKRMDALVNQGQEGNEAMRELAEAMRQAGDRANQSKDDFGRVNSKLDETSTLASKAGASIKGLMTGALAQFGIGLGIKELASQLISVRSEVESLEVSFKTLAGEQEGAKLFSEIREFAVSTPMLVKDLAAGAQTMLGFNIAIEDIMPNLRALGDVSMGDSQKFNSLVLAFSQVSAAGKMMTQDCNQMINVGFNPLQVISEKTGKSLGQLREEMEKGAISAEMVRDAFMTVTSEGGKFYGMLDAQSKTIQGALSNLQGAWEDLLNEIGQGGQEAFVEGIEGLTSLLKNIDRLKQAVGTVVVALGTYKVAMLATSPAAMTAYHGIGVVIKGLVAHRAMTLKAIAGVRALNAALMSNPYTAIAVAVATLATALYTAYTRTSELREAQDRVNQSMASANVEVSKEISELDELKERLEKAKKGSDEWKKAKDEIVSRYGEYHEGLDEEITKVGDLSTAYDTLTGSIRKSIVAKGMKEYYDNEVTEFQTKQHEALTDYADELSKNKKIGLGTKNNLLQAARLYTEGKHEGIPKEWLRMFRTKDGLREAAQANIAMQSGLRSYQDIYGFTTEEMKEILNGGGKKTASTTPNPTPTITPTSAQKVKDIEAILEKQTKEMIVLERKGAEALADERIAAMEEGWAKEEAELQLRQDRELQALEDEKQALLDKKKANDRELWEADPKNKGKKYEGGAVSLSAEELEQFNAREKAMTQRHKRESEDLETKRWEEAYKAMVAYYASWGTNEEKRDAIKAQYDEKIANATTEGEKKTLEAEKENALAEFDKSVFLSTKRAKEFFSDFSKKSKEELKSLGDYGKRVLSMLKSDTYDATEGTDLGISAEMFEALKNDPELINSILEKLGDLNDGTTLGIDAFKKLGEAIRDAFKGKGSIDDFAGAMVASMQVAQQAAGFLGNAFGDLSAAFDSEELKSVSETIQDVGKVLDSAIGGAAAGAAVGGGWGALIGAVVGAGTALVSVFAKNADKDRTEAIETFNKLIKDYDRVMDQIKRARKTKFAQDLAMNLEEENNAIRKQIALLQQMRWEEEQKKHTSKEQLQQYDDQIYKLNEQIKDNEEAAIDAIFGQDIKGAIEGFADAIASAWESGKSAASSTKKYVRQMIRAMVVEAMKADLSEPMKRLRSMMQAAMADGVVTAEEQGVLENAAEYIANDIEKKYAWSDNLFKDATDQSASVKGFERMTVDQADELNGRFTALQMAGENIKNSVWNIEAEMRGVASKIANQAMDVKEIHAMSITAIGHLENIARNTQELYGIKSELQEIRKQTKHL